MSTDPKLWDFSQLEEVWARRRARLEQRQLCIDRRGLTRPRRNPAERAWLQERGELPPTVEIDTPLNEQGSTPKPRAPRSENPAE